MVDINSKNRVVDRFIRLESMFNSDGSVASVNRLREYRKEYRSSL